MRDRAGLIFQCAGWPSIGCFDFRGDGMTALFEGGNSRLHFAWWDCGEISETRDIAYLDYPGDLSGMISTLIGYRAPECMAACSVSPVWGEPLFRTLDSIYPGIVRIARTSVDAGVKITYDRPEMYGIDRALAAAAAYHEVRGACVVVDAGTPVTVDVGR